MAKVPKLCLFLSLIGVTPLCGEALRTPVSKAVTSSIPHGIVQRFVYLTAVAKHLPNGREHYYVYTPPGYDGHSSIKYPVLYLLHGWLQHAGGWTQDGDANVILDNLIAHGKARPMIVVMPECYGNYRFLFGGLPIWEMPSKIDENNTLFSQMLVSEIIPRVESSYRVSKKSKDRAIAGLSMGGMEAVTTGLGNPDKFQWIGGFSAALPRNILNSPAVVSPSLKDFRLVWIAYGVSDMNLIVNGNRQLIKKLKESGVSVTAIETPGRHEWPVWRYNLTQFLPLLFRTGR